MMLKEVKSYLKKFRLMRLLRSLLREIWYLYREQISKIIIVNILREKKEINLEIGAGNAKGEDGWITLDMTKECDIFWNLQKGLPFPTNSINKIYSSHLFEHFTFREGNDLLKECLRVLKTDGTFSICVPNAKIYIDAYSNNIDLDDDFLSYSSGYPNLTKIDYINYIAYMDGQHKYLFDIENLVLRLNNNGFRNVSSRDFDPEKDLKVREEESIYAVAVK